MSQRIADSLEVLDLIRVFSRQYPNELASFWRQNAVSHVASRGVEKNTVFAHLVGKNTRHKLSAYDIDRLIKDWITDGSEDLQKWILKSCGKTDDERVNHFFISDQSTPLAIDINDPEQTEKHLVTTYRVLRDTALARRIKADNDYTCQICGEKLSIGDGKPYAEAHHIKPLGNPHNGPDHPGNIVCVCPNCHVKLDYGSIKINQTLFINILPEFIEYHNEIIAKN
ncbi:HNH endonuclease [Thermodesulfobacteriota bacterium]